MTSILYADVTHWHKGCWREFERTVKTAGIPPLEFLKMNNIKIRYDKNGDTFFDFESEEDLIIFKLKYS